MPKSERRTYINKFRESLPFRQLFFFSFFFYRCTIFVFNLNVSAAKYAATIFSTTFQLSILGNFERRFEFRTKASRIRSTSPDAIFKTTPENSDGLCSPPIGRKFAVTLAFETSQGRQTRANFITIVSCWDASPLFFSFFFLVLQMGMHRRRAQSDGLRAIDEILLRLKCTNV